MRKNIFIYMLILLVCILPYNNVHASTDLQIDRLIENEQKQKEISKCPFGFFCKIKGISTMSFYLSDFTLKGQIFRDTS